MALLIAFENGLVGHLQFSSHSSGSTWNHLIGICELLIVKYIVNSFRFFGMQRSPIYVKLLQDVVSMKQCSAFLKAGG